MKDRDCEAPCSRWKLPEVRLELLTLPESSPLTNPQRPLQSTRLIVGFTMQRLRPRSLPHMGLVISANSPPGRSAITSAGSLLSSALARTEL